LLKSLILFIFVIFPTLSGTLVVAAPDIFDDVRSEIIKGNREKAIVLLKEGTGKDKYGADDKSLAYFALGALSYQVGNLRESELHLKNSLSAGTRLIEYANLFLGRFYKHEGKYSEAHHHFREVRLPWGSVKNVVEARFELGLLAVLERDWHQALMHFEYLSRRMKGSDFYPQILWNLTLAELKLRRPAQACATARKLYTKYPTHPLVYNWGIDLNSAKIDGESLGCYATATDVEMRIQRLQWLGESDRARKEIEGLREKVTGVNEYHVDMMMANYLIGDGLVDEAFNLLARHYDERKNHPKYLMMLAKAANRAQKFTLAVGAYYRVYELTPRSRTGRTALFRSASLSYQFQDYDGAGRKFDLIINKFPRSGLVRDAYWHVAWIKYLKGNYDSAYEAFTDLTKQAQRSKRFWRSLSSEKTNYWRGMCLLRLERKLEARKFFEALDKDSSFGYYSILAKSRLMSLPQIETEVRVPAQADIMSNGIGGAPAPDLSISKNGEEAEPVVVSEEEESESTVNTEEAEDAGEETATTESTSESGTETAVADTEPAEEENKEMILPMTFGSPAFIRKYQRAQDLIRLGFFEWARWEMYDLEGKVRNAKNLRILINQYQALDSFHRSAYVGFVALGAERRKKGIEGAKDLWEAAYPMAYANFVKTSASEFSVPSHFVWSIIRAESQYKADAKSPTGAVGLMQVMPFTAKQVARILKDDNDVVDKLAEPNNNIRIGTKYLARLFKKFSNVLPLVAAGYNAGPHRVDGWLSTFGLLDMDEFVEHIPFVETRDYVRRVVSNMYVYDLLYTGRESPMKWLVEPVGVKGDLLSSYREGWED